MIAVRQLDNPVTRLWESHVWLDDEVVAVGSFLTIDGENYQARIEEPHIRRVDELLNSDDVPADTQRIELLAAVNLQAAIDQDVAETLRRRCAKTLVRYAAKTGEVGLRSIAKQFDLALDLLNPKDQGLEAYEACVRLGTLHLHSLRVERHEVLVRGYRGQHHESIIEQHLNYSLHFLERAGAVADGLPRLSKARRIVLRNRAFGLRACARMVRGDTWSGSQLVDEACGALRDLGTAPPRGSRIPVSALDAGG